MPVLLSSQDVWYSISITIHIITSSTDISTGLTLTFVARLVVTPTTYKCKVSPSLH